MKKQAIIMGTCIGILLLISIVKNLNSNQELIEIKPLTLEDTEDEALALDPDNQEPLLYIVDVKGEIEYPGIYEVDETYRVHDVVLLAGGMTELAKSDSINFAQKVRDEMVIYIPNIHNLSSFKYTYPF